MHFIFLSIRRPPRSTRTDTLVHDTALCRPAHEAARLIAEGGIRDFHQAKLKAAERLGILDDASLPRNREIEDALREYQRLFQRDNEIGRATSELQSLMRISYAVFCLKKKKT